MDNVKNLALFMLMYILVEWSLVYSKRTGNLWFYSKDEATDLDNNIENTNNFKCFK